MVRVAALQFATGTVLETNLETCLRMIDQAASEHGPALLVLPEFCNHVAWYDDPEHAESVALELDGPFLAEISGRARQHACTVVINVSLRREPGQLTVTSLMYGPDGSLLAQADKQALMGHENAFFTPARERAPVVDTGFARVGMYPCRDGVTMETPRCLALDGAQVLCNSLNSFALDEASLHVAARAVENHCFVVAANKVGALVPGTALESTSEATQIPVPFLYGAGESQILAPDGRVLARAAREGEAIIVAQIEPAEADDKRAHSGADTLARRRPDLYRSIAESPRQPRNIWAAPQLQAAIWPHPPDTEDLVREACRAASEFASGGGELLVLPELFCFADTDFEDPSQAAEAFEPVVRALCEACHGHGLHIATSLVEAVAGRYFHTGVLVGQAGIIARQRQLHTCERYPWTEVGGRQEVFPTPYGGLALLVGDDAYHPEIAKVAALQGAHVFACPLGETRGARTRIGLLSLAAENRTCLVAASRTPDGDGNTLLDLEREFTLMQPWRERIFDGNLNTPISVRAQEEGPAVVTATLHPDAARNKCLSAGTELLDGRPWQLLGPLCATQTTDSHAAGEGSVRGK